LSHLRVVHLIDLKWDWNFPHQSGLLSSHSSIFYYFSTFFWYWYITFGIISLDSRVFLLQTSHCGVFTLNISYEALNHEIFIMRRKNIEEHVVKLYGSQSFYNWKYLFKVFSFYLFITLVDQYFFVSYNLSFLIYIILEQKFQADKNVIIKVWKKLPSAITLNFFEFFIHLFHRKLVLTILTHIFPLNLWEYGNISILDEFPSILDTNPLINNYRTFWVFNLYLPWWALVPLCNIFFLIIFFSFLFFLTAYLRAESSVSSHFSFSFDFNVWGSVSWITTSIQ